MLISGVALFMAFWNFNMLENYMVAKLYKLKPSREGSSDQDKSESESGVDLDKRIL